MLHPYGRMADIVAVENYLVVLVGLHTVCGLPLWYRLGDLFVKCICLTTIK